MRKYIYYILAMAMAMGFVSPCFAADGDPVREGKQMTGTLKTAKGSDVASANAMAPGEGNFFDVTGTTTINTIATKGIGTMVVLQFDGILQLTHSADLVLPTGANITTAAGDLAALYEYATGDWRCLDYTRADGTPLADCSTTAGTIGTTFYSDDIPVIGTGANNDIEVGSLLKFPSGSAEDVHTIVCDTNTVLGPAFIYNTALGGTTIDAGEWLFVTYGSVEAVLGGRVSSITRNIYHVVVDASTITTTGIGASSRTATAAGGTPFASDDDNADITLSGYLQTPQGLYQITGYTSATVVTIATPSGYTNEAGAAFSTWKKKFGISTGTIGAIGTLYTSYSTRTVQSEIVIAATDKLAEIVFGVANKETDVYFVHNGTVNYSQFRTPIATRHNDMPGLNGGTTAEYYHLTESEYTGTGTGDFVREDSPTLEDVGIGTSFQAGALHTVLSAGKPAIFGGAPIATLTGVTVSNADPSVLTKDATIDDGLAVGDIVNLNSGTNGTVSTYIVASIVANTSVTLDRQAATGTCTDASITYVNGEGLAVTAGGALHLSDGVGAFIIRQYNEPGLGSRTTIGLPEVSRTMVICDAGDVDTDFGLAATNDVSLIIMRNNKTAYGKLISDSGNSRFGIEAYSQGLFFRTATSIYNYLGADLTSGNYFRVESGGNYEFIDDNGEQSWGHFEPKINQSGTAAYNGLHVNVLETTPGTSIGDGTTGQGNNLLLLERESVPYFKVGRAGMITKTVVAGITATDPGVQGNNVLTAPINEISVCGTADDAVTLPAAAAGLEIKIINNGAQQLEIWPNTDDDVGAGVNTAITLAAGSNLHLVAFNDVTWEVF